MIRNFPKFLMLPIYKYIMYQLNNLRKSNRTLKLQQSKYQLCYPISRVNIPINKLILKYMCMLFRWYNMNINQLHMLNSTMNMLFPLQNILHYLSYYNLKQLHKLLQSKNIFHFMKYILHNKYLLKVNYMILIGQMNHNMFHQCMDNYRININIYSKLILKVDYKK